MNFRKIIIQFFVSWFIFIIVATVLSFLQSKLEFPSLLKTFNNYLFPIIAYGLIFTYLRGFRRLKDLIKVDRKVSLLSLIACLIIALGLQIFNQVFVDLYYYLFKPEILDFLYINTPKSSLKFWLTSLSAILFSPIFEELLFRGYFFKKISSIKGPIFAAVTSSLFFSLVHLPLFGKLLPSFIIGIILCYLLWKTKSIVLPIVLHALNNALAIISDFYMPALWKPIFDLEFNFTYWSVIAVGVAIILVGVWILRISSNKENPRENL